MSTDLTFINPNITPVAGADLYPIVKQRMPRVIHEDCPWLITKGGGGVFIVTDLYMGASIVVFGCAALEDLQRHLSYSKVDLWKEFA